MQITFANSGDNKEYTIDIKNGQKIDDLTIHDESGNEVEAKFQIEDNVKSYSPWAGWDKFEDNFELALGTLFDAVDNGDGVFDETELKTLEYLINKKDNAPYSGGADGKIGGGDIFQILGTDDLFNCEYNIDLIKSIIDADNKDNLFNFLNLAENSSYNMSDILDLYKEIREEDFSNSVKNNKDFSSSDKNEILDKANTILLKSEFPKTDDDTIASIVGLKSANSSSSIEFLKSITPDNAGAVAIAYEYINGKTLEDFINDCLRLNTSEKEEIIKIVEDGKKAIYEEKYGFDSSYQAQTQVENKYYTGDIFNVSQDGDTLTVQKQDSNETAEINLKEICSEFPAEKQAMLKTVIQKLPGEVIMDLANEVSKIGVYSNTNDRSVYSPTNDLILIADSAFSSEESLRRTLIHELGHTIDFVFEDSKNSSSCALNPQINYVYEKEVANYVNAGHTRHTEKWNGQYYELISGDASDYCTFNVKEMFAMFYETAMNGKSPSDKCIEEYFSQTCELMQEHLYKIREYDSKDRHR